MAQNSVMLITKKQHKFAIVSSYFKLYLVVQKQLKALAHFVSLGILHNSWVLPLLFPYSHKTQEAYIGQSFRYSEVAKCRMSDSNYPPLPLASKTFKPEHFGIFWHVYPNKRMTLIENSFLTVHHQTIKTSGTKLQLVHNFLTVAWQ